MKRINNITRYRKYKKSTYFVGLIFDRFQWLGFIISTDNPIVDKEYLLFELRFIFLRFWYSYELKTPPNKQRGNEQTKNQNEVQGNK